VIHDFMPASDHTHPLFAALFSLHMLICTPKGRAYSADEYRTWLGERGFVEAQEMALGTDRPTATTAIVARKPWASLGTA
jgi:3-hydroxy-5-methyl-1-naphthoate 3-O-methyltransferase